MAKLSPTDSWNHFIESLLEVRSAWEDHKEVMQEYRTLDKLPIEAQRQLRYTSIHKASDFERMMLQFVNRWRTSGGLESMIIVLPKVKEVKPTTKKESVKK